jgi:hypothetical protein
MNPLRNKRSRLFPICFISFLIFLSSCSTSFKAYKSFRYWGLPVFVFDSTAIDNGAILRIPADHSYYHLKEIFIDSRKTEVHENSVVILPPGEHEIRLRYLFSYGVIDKDLGSTSTWTPYGMKTTYSSLQHTESGLFTKNLSIYFKKGKSYYVDDSYNSIESRTSSFFKMTALSVATVGFCILMLSLVK